MVGRHILSGFHVSCVLDLPTRLLSFSMSVHFLSPCLLFFFLVGLSFSCWEHQPLLYCISRECGAEGFCGVCNRTFLDGILSVFNRVPVLSRTLDAVIFLSQADLAQSSGPSGVDCWPGKCFRLSSKQILHCVWGESGRERGLSAEAIWNRWTVLRGALCSGDRH